MIIWVLILIALLLLGVFGWMANCNNTTYNQRTKIIDVVFAGNTPSRYVEMFQAVSYDRHFYSLVFFKRPPYAKELYQFLEKQDA